MSRGAEAYYLCATYVPPRLPLSVHDAMTQRRGVLPRPIGRGADPLGPNLKMDPLGF